MLFAFDFLASLRGSIRQGAADRLPRLSAHLPTLAKDSDARLRERADLLRHHADPIESLALVAESVRRTHGLTAHDAQLRAGLALAEGSLVEMATGEGKTLSALLPAFFFALRGRGAHVATVNAYLAERDAAFAQPVFARLGLTVGLLRENDPSIDRKRAAYECDVTYGVGTEFGVDYLRDQLALCAHGRMETRLHEILLRRLPPKPSLRQRGLAFAVIDDADSVLLDEARSPLVIAIGERRPSATPEAYRLAEEIARDLQVDLHYERHARNDRLTLTADGERVAFARLTDTVRHELRRPWPQYLENALHLRHHLRREVNYIFADDRVTIVDPFTGRQCPDRTWRDGLHQAAEAHAGVTITDELCSEATISHPEYFRLYERTCGITSTAIEASAELRATYNLQTVVIPPHRPCQRISLPDRIFTTRAASYAALAREVSARHATGQPILIGTRNIETSEAVAAALRSLGLSLRVLHGRQDAAEAATIERAGERGAITVATNMAGRGAPIPLSEESIKTGGLHIIGLERHESGRVDRQLIGRTARQGEPGSVQFFLSLEDDLVKDHAPILANRDVLSARKDELAGRHAVHFQRAQRKVETLAALQRRVLASHRCRPLAA
jgi:preprotein translocase subunit SecA